MSYLCPAVHCLLLPIASGLGTFCVKQLLQGSENKDPLPLWKKVSASVVAERCHELNEYTQGAMANGHVKAAAVNGSSTTHDACIAGCSGKRSKNEEQAGGASEQTTAV